MLKPSTAGVPPQADVPSSVRRMFQIVTRWRFSLYLPQAQVLENLFNYLIIIDTSDHIHRAFAPVT